MRLFLLVIAALFPTLLVADDIAAKKFFTGKTKIEHPEKLRDPFAMTTYEINQNSNDLNLVKKIPTSFSNVKVESITNLNQLKIVGVIIGPQKKAIAKIGNNGTIILKEGMKLGEDGAELKVIMSGGVIFVEKIVNIYGEEEYLETVIPVTLN